MWWLRWVGVIGEYRSISFTVDIGINDRPPLRKLISIYRILHNFSNLKHSSGPR